MTPADRHSQRRTMVGRIRPKVEHRAAQNALKASRGIVWQFDILPAASGEDSYGLLLFLQDDFGGFLPAHDYFGQILDSDGTVLLCLHKWVAHEHPSLMSPDHGTPGNGLLLFFRVDDFHLALQSACSLLIRLEEEPHLNSNTRTKEFSLRDPDGNTLRSVRSLATKMRTICTAECSRSSHELVSGPLRRGRPGDHWHSPLTEHKEYRNMKPKNTICLWFDKDALEAARFYAATFPDSKVTAVHNAPGDYPSGKEGDVLTVEFTVLGIPCLGLNGGPAFRHSEAFSFQIATENQEETDRYWNAIVRNGGVESQCGWCKDRWGLSWQITPRALTDALAAGGGEAKRAFESMMTMNKIDIATIEAARRR
jgi:predicted 3-demethylubiquinone-9 3-methyltransferase (glyoxalase superfamily)